MSIELESAELSLCDSASTFLQSGFWASFKAQFGWKAKPFLVRTEAQPSGESLLVLERGLAAGLSFAYVPHGPTADPVGAASTDDPTEGRSAYLASIAGALKPRLSASSLFLRFDPPWYLAEAKAGAEGALGDERLESDPASDVGSEAPAPISTRQPARPCFASPLRKAAADIQPPDTVILDLIQPEDEILAGMKPKWRYNIRLAEKKGVAVSETRADGDWQPALSRFYELYRATSERDHIALHPEAYYRKLFETASSYRDARGSSAGYKPDLRIFTASHEGNALAAIITIFWGGQAVYLYGASSNEKRNLMPTYALQWSALRAARAEGCGFYDFYGIPPVEDPDHPMAGLYRFKTGFGGTIIHRGGAWDYALRPVAYASFRKAEALRQWYYKDFRKRRAGGGEAKPS